MKQCFAFELTVICIFYYNVWKVREINGGLTKNCSCLFFNSVISSFLYHVFGQNKTKWYSNNFTFYPKTFFWNPVFILVFWQICLLPYFLHLFVGFFIFHYLVLVLLKNIKFQCKNLENILTFLTLLSACFWQYLKC